MKPWYTSKLLWAGVVMVSLGVAEYFAGLPAGTSISQAIAGAFVVALRLITKTALTK